MGAEGQSSTTVLCVDDTPGLAELTARYLKRASDELVVRTATSARDGLAVLETESIDCIVSDYDMPEMDGLMFLQIVRADDPDLPFILLTGHGSETVASDAISAGVTDYVQKGSGTTQYELLARRIQNAVAQFRARSEAQELQQRTDTVLDVSPDAIIVSSEDYFVYANNAAVGLFGVDNERVLRSSAIDDFVADDDRETVARVFARVASGERSVEHVPRVVLSLDDGPLPVELTARNIVWNGEPGVVAVLRDRSKREAEKQLQARYQGAFEEAFDAMVVADDDGRYIEANRSACELFELEKSELIGRRIADFAREDFDVDQGWTLFEDNGTDRGTFPLVTATGTEKTLEYAATRNIVPGEHLSVLRDVTDREAYVDEIERQKERLDEFASVVSHDLRNPLQTVIGTLPAARESGDPEQFERIERNLDRMERIIADVLWLAREGEDIGATERVSLRQAVTDAWDVIRTDTDAAMLEFDDDLGRLDADYDRLCQLLENVLRNAVEHGQFDDATISGRPRDRLTVHVERLDDGFAIEDDGPGIPVADRERVFERGYSSTDDGTGFGLHIVSVIAAAHGWDVRATEGRHGGARFEFTGIDTM